MDDDDDDIALPPTRPNPMRSAPATASRVPDDGQQWGRDIRNDIRNFGSGNSSASSRIGAGGVGIGGMDNPEDDDLGLLKPQTAARPRPPSSPRSAAPNTMPPAGMGLSQKVASLEMSVLGKTYNGDILTKRISRLEAQVFPTDKTVVNKSLVERVDKLVAVVGVSVPQPAPPRVAQRAQDPDLADLNNGMPPTAPPRGGLSKLINQMGNVLGGNNGFVGGYPVPGTLVPDPGNPALMMDPATGNLINPANGMIVGKRVMQATPGAGYPYGSTTMPPFGSGFSPMGGVQFGVGGMGVGRGGMWP
jgi:hypothetical protein